MPAYSDRSLFRSLKQPEDRSRHIRFLDVLEVEIERISLPIKLQLIFLTPNSLEGQEIDTPIIPATPVIAAPATRRQIE